MYLEFKLNQDHVWIWLFLNDTISNEVAQQKVLYLCYVCIDHVAKVIYILIMFYLDLEEMSAAVLQHYSGFNCLQCVCKHIHTLKAKTLFLSQ